MGNNDHFYRLEYERGEEVRFVSHLDFVKVFERALRRASVDVAYSEGFNPRMLLVFGNPLPVGFTSKSEFVDIRTTADYDPGKLAEMLNGALPSPVRIKSAIRLEKPYEPIVRSIGFNTYTVFTDAGDSAAEKLICAYESACRIETVKRSKSGPKTVDIKAHVRRFFYEGEGRFVIETSGGQENNLRPDTAFKAAAENADCGGINILHIRKTASSA